MNYPYSVTGGQAAFFSNFEYRFSDQELLFIGTRPSGSCRWETRTVLTTTGSRKPPHKRSRC